MKPRVTDKQVEDAIRLFQSAGKAADALGISYRAICTRRRKIEERTGQLLPIRDHRARYNTVVEEGNAVVRYAIRDGTILIGSDAHIWPGERTTVQRAFVRLAKELKPNAIVLNGDFFDGARLSRFASIGWEKRPEVWEELKAVTEYLATVEDASPRSKRFWSAGNHDMRFESRLANVATEYANIKGVHLKDHLANWIPCWRLDVNDNIVIRHRELGGEHADFRNVQTSGKSMFTGHDHRLGVVLYHDYTGLRYGVRSGFMCDSPRDPQFVHYLEAKEPNWWPGFVVVTFKAGVMLMPELCIRHTSKDSEGEVQWRGQILRV